jgi:hypothetical protein
MHIPQSRLKTAMRIVLPSNASSKYFPDNTIAKYTVQLPYPIDLNNGSWVIGLSEIQFYKSWFNVKDSQLTITTDIKSIIISLDDGYYKTNEFLINSLNKKLEKNPNREVCQSIKFIYNEISRTCGLELGPLPAGHGNAVISLSKELKSILNLDPNNIETHQENSIIKASSPMQLTTIYNLMVYSDIAKTNIIGEIEAPLLRAIPVEGDHWQYQCTSPRHIQYIPITQKEIRNISIYIYTDYGELCPFTRGRCIVTLDLQKTPINYLF